MSVRSQCVNYCILDSIKLGYYQFIRFLDYFYVQSQVQMPGTLVAQCFGPLLTKYIDQADQLEARLGTCAALSKLVCIIMSDE